MYGARREEGSSLVLLEGGQGSGLDLIKEYCGKGEEGSGLDLRKEGVNCYCERGEENGVVG